MHELEIDETFVIGVARDSSDAAIVRSPIDLAHHMGLAVVAEFVEDEDTLDALRALRCEFAQGYWLSRPLAHADVIEWMKSSPWTRVAPVEAKLLRRVV